MTDLLPLTFDLLRGPAGYLVVFAAGLATGLFLGAGMGWRWAPRRRSER